jgi:hypothetical protein
MSDQKLIGYVETDSGSLFIVDGVWKESIPTVFQKSLFYEDALVDEKKNVLPVYLIKNQGKRFLLIALDDGIAATEREVQVETEDPVELPEPPPPPAPEAPEEEEEPEENEDEE